MKLITLDYINLLLEIYSNDKHKLNTSEKALVGSFEEVLRKILISEAKDEKEIK